MRFGMPAGEQQFLAIFSPRSMITSFFYSWISNRPDLITHMVKHDS